MDGLKLLRKQVVSTKILGDTQAGKRVRALSKHSEPRVAAAALEVVAAWKEVVKKEARDSHAAHDKQPHASEAAPAAAASPAADKPESSAGVGSQAGKSEGTGPQAQPSRKSTDGGAEAGSAGVPVPCSQGTQGSLGVSSRLPSGELDVPKTGDSIRNKCRNHLAVALQQAVAEGAEGGDPGAAAVAVENALYAAHNGVSAAYKTKFRQLHFNLKDEKNPDLRRHVLVGDLGAEELISLAPEELASDAKREENDRIRQEKLFHSVPSAAIKATTDQFQCGKCRQRKCSYFQMQTRSADEPMTT